ncbi:hypothetical protein BT69DRAFT_1349096 [Atractiella rhizophila]|nr:hypothetical protein BT69DRAFT_1349096 [Atractiella rhizophila]
MLAQTRAQAKKVEAAEQERKRREELENSFKLRSGRMMARAGTAQWLINIGERKRKLAVRRSTVQEEKEGHGRKRRKLGAREVSKTSVDAVAEVLYAMAPSIRLHPIPSLQSVVSGAPGDFDTTNLDFQSLHAAHLDRLRDSKTSIPQQSILAADLLSNRFYCSYLSTNSRNSPGLSREQQIGGDGDSVEEWMDDHVIACRVVPLLNRPLSGIFSPEFLRLRPEEEDVLEDIAALSLEDLEFDDRVKIPKEHRFKKLFDELKGVLRGGGFNEKDGRRLFHALSKPIFESKFIDTGSTCKLNFDWLRGHIDDSIPLAGKRFSVSRYHDVTLSVSDPPMSNPVSVANFFFRMEDTLRPPANYGTAYRKWYTFRGRIRDNRKYPTKYREANPPIPSRTPTPPPIPTHSEYLETQKIPSKACYATELKLMLAQISANAKEYGVGDHEAVVVGMTNLRMHFSVAYFPEDHIRNAMEKSILPTDSLIYFLQSEEYDLATVDGRRGALNGVIALTNFLLSGKAKIGRLQKYFSDNPTHPSTS